MNVLNSTELGQLIKTYRKMNNMTQSHLAETVEIDEKQLGKIERGVHFPSVPTFLKLIKVLNIDIKNFYHSPQNILIENSFASKFEKLPSKDMNIIADIIDVFLNHQ